MHTVCTSYAHSMHITCTPYVNHCTLYAHYTYYMYIILTLYVELLFSEIPQSVNIVISLPLLKL